MNRSSLCSSVSLSRLALSSLALAALAACGGGDNEDTPAATSQSVAVEFVATVGDTPVTCASVLSGLGSGSVNAVIQDLRFYVSNLALINDKGATVKVTLDSNAFQLTSGDNTLALVDLEDDTGACAGDSALNVKITGTVPIGTYTGAKFTLGVPAALNHLDVSATTTQAPLNNNDMYWSWTTGYKHVKIEINPDNAAAPGTFTSAIVKSGAATGANNTSFFFHLGDTSCTVPAGGSAASATCASVNTRDIHFHDFDATKKRIAVDLKALFASSNLLSERGGAGGCMSGPTDLECQDMWPVLGSTFSVDGAGAVTATSVTVQDATHGFFHGETVFRPVAK
ncbi:MAG: metallo-mystery pair system four-Cys motif protein [Burkholderiales bacterium]|nr:metallo-mystery pair system four-Cys motif protein [Burkholderiales bacterium]